MKNKLAIGLALALPITIQSAAMADTLNLQQAPTGADVAAKVHQAKDRLETAKVRLSIAKKQVVAAKARLKACEAEFKAAKANHHSCELQHQAHKLSESSGLPAITNAQVEENKQRSLAQKLTNTVRPAKDSKVKEVDLSKTRIRQVDFNAPNYENQVKSNSHSSYVPKRKYLPLKKATTSQAQLTNTGTGLVATSGNNLEQPPIVP